MQQVMQVATVIAHTTYIVYSDSSFKVQSDSLYKVPRQFMQGAILTAPSKVLL